MHFWHLTIIHSAVKCETLKKKKKVILFYYISSIANFTFLNDSLQGQCWCDGSPGALLSDIQPLSCHHSWTALQGVLLLVSESRGSGLSESMPNTVKSGTFHSQPRPGVFAESPPRCHVQTVTRAALYPIGTATGPSVASCCQKWRTRSMGWFKTSSTMSTGEPLSTSEHLFIMHSVQKASTLGCR